MNRSRSRAWKPGRCPGGGHAPSSLSSGPWEKWARSWVPPGRAPCRGEGVGLSGRSRSLRGEEDAGDILRRLRKAALIRQYSYRTVEAYEHWVRRYFSFHRRNPGKVFTPEGVKTFLEDLVVERKLPAATQRRALNALHFLFGDVVGLELGDLGDFARSRRPKIMPVVLAREEVERLLGEIDGVLSLAAGLLYGSGLRLMEALRLRVKDVDFSLGRIQVLDGKGRKERTTMLPERFRGPLAAHSLA